MAMTKTQKKIDSAPEDLFEQAANFALKQEQVLDIDATAGSYNIDSTIRELITSALKNTPQSRYQIAATMSELIGCEITKFQLDSWSAESKDGHRFPIQYIPAFCKATKDNTIVRFISKKLGGAFIDGRDSFYMELGKCENERRALAKREKLIRDILQVGKVGE